jgi:protein-disulfide isomerase
MASRAQQKEEARQRRLAEEQARTERARRQRRLQMILGTILIAVILVVVAIAVSSGGGGNSAPKVGSPAAKKDAAEVGTLLAGIPQSGNTLGSSSAKVTVTEFGDLQCPVCRSFALGIQNQLIANDVRSGKVKLVYRSLCTATCNGPNPNVFPTQQAAALAAGLQNRGWYYIELFYKEQGSEGTNYVNDAYLNGLASQVPGLNYSKWLSDRSSSTLTGQVTADEQTASGKNFTSTPTLDIAGPKGEAQPIVGVPSSYSALESAIKSVS